MHHPKFTTDDIPSILPKVYLPKYNDTQLSLWRNLVSETDLKKIRPEDRTRRQPDSQYKLLSEKQRMKRSSNQS